MGSGVKVGELYSLLRLERGGFDQAVRGAGASVTGLSGKFDQLIKKPGLFGAAMKGLGIGAGISVFGLLERGIRSVVDAFGEAVAAAKEQQVASTALDTALKANVDGYDGNLDAINKVIDARLRLGFTDNQQAEALAVLVAMTKDSAASLDIERTAMDLARLKHMDLAAASVILGKAYNGNFIALKRLGIQVDKGTTGIEALGLVQQRVAGQAEAFGKTEEGAAAGAAAEWEKFQEDLGNLLLPVLTKLQQTLRDDVIPALRDAMPIIAEIAGIFVSAARYAVPALAVALGVKLVAAFGAARAAGIEAATAIRLSWGAALLGIPILMAAAEDLAKQNPPAPEWWSGMSNAEKAAWIEIQRVNDVEGRRWAGNTRSFIDRQVDEFGRLKLEIPEELQAAGDSANAIITSSFAGFAARMQDGRTIFAGSAEDLVDILPHALADAKARAEEEAAKVPKGLADAILGSIDDLDGIRKAITDAIAGAVTDAKAIAEAEAILAGEDITSGFKKGSTELDVALLESLNKVITSMNILAPAALLTGEGIPPALRDGIDKNMGLMVDAVQRIHDSVGSHLNLADFARQMGYDGLADYIDGMESAHAPDSARRQASSVRTELELNLYGAGYNAGWSWVGGLTSGMRDGLVPVQRLLGQYGRFLEGNSPPPEGPLKNLDTGAHNAAQSWVDEFLGTLRQGALQPVLAGFIPGEGAPALARGDAAAVAFPARPSAQGAQEHGGIQMTIAHLELNGIGSDVTPGAARRFADAILDEVAVGLQEQGSRFGSRPRVSLG